MSEKKRGLGRGLGALIPTAPTKDDVRAPSAPSPVDVLIPDRSAEPADAVDAPAEVAGAYFAELALTTITPNPRQPREVFDEDAMAELVHSVREVGLLQPIVVRSVGPDRYELIMGE